MGSLNHQTRMRLLFVWIDGFDGEYVKNHLDSLPNLKDLSTKGRMGTCRSVLVGDEAEPSTGPNVVSIITGVPPMVHGVTTGGFVHGEDTYDKIQVMTIFDNIGKHHTLWIYNFPMTYPASAVKPNGYCVSGFPSVLRERICHPEWLEKELPQDYRTDLIFGSSCRVKWRFDPSTPNDTVNLEWSKVKLFKSLYDKYPADTAFIGFTLIDRLFHAGIWWVGEKPAYAHVDELLGYLLASFEPENLMITADHGFKGRNHDCNAFYYNSRGLRAASVMDNAHIAQAILGINEPLGVNRT